MFRAAILEDKDAVAHVLMESRRTFLPYARSPHTEAETLDWVAQQLIPDGRVTVTVKEKKLVAILAVSEDESYAWIDQLYVLPGYENQGLGSRLLVAYRVIMFPFEAGPFSERGR